MDSEGVGCFSDTDRFIRRVCFSNQIKRRVVAWQAFRDRNGPLSLTYQDETLQTSQAIDAYQAHRKFKDGTLPGLLLVSYGALTKRVQPPLEPTFVEDKDDPVYGHLHYETPSPNESQCRQLAKIVMDGAEGAVLRHVIPPSARDQL